MRTKAFILFIFLLGVSEGSAQVSKYNLQGFVVDNTDSSKLAYENIILLSAQDSTYKSSATTDSKGWYQFSEIDSGAYLLRVLSLSYTPLFLSVNLSSDTIVTPLLTKADYTIPEIGITANKPLFRLEGSKRVYLTANDLKTN